MFGGAKLFKHPTSQDGPRARYENEDTQRDASLAIPKRGIFFEMATSQAMEVEELLNPSSRTNVQDEGMAGSHFPSTWNARTYEFAAVRKYK